MRRYCSPLKQIQPFSSTRNGTAQQIPNYLSDLAFGKSNYEKYSPLPKQIDSNGITVDQINSSKEFIHFPRQSSNSSRKLTAEGSQKEFLRDASYQTKNKPRFIIHTGPNTRETQSCQQDTSTQTNQRNNSFDLIPTDSSKQLGKFSSKPRNGQKEVNTNYGQYNLFSASIATTPFKQESPPPSPQFRKFSPQINDFSVNDYSEQNKSNNHHRLTPPQFLSSTVVKNGILLAYKPSIGHKISHTTPQVCNFIPHQSPLPQSIPVKPIAPQSSQQLLQSMASSIIDTLQQDYESLYHLKTQKIHKNSSRSDVQSANNISVDMGPQSIQRSGSIIHYSYSTQTVVPVKYRGQVQEVQIQKKYQTMIHNLPYESSLLPPPSLTDPPKDVLRGQLNIIYGVNFKSRNVQHISRKDNDSIVDRISKHQNPSNVNNNTNRSNKITNHQDSTIELRPCGFGCLLLSNNHRLTGQFWNGLPNGNATYEWLHQNGRDVIQWEMGVYKNGVRLTVIEMRHNLAVSGVNGINRVVKSQQKGCFNYNNQKEMNPSINGDSNINYLANPNFFRQYPLTKYQLTKKNSASTQPISARKLD